MTSARQSPIDTIVDCLVQIAVDEYLASEAARQAALDPERSDHVPLPDVRKAA